MPRLLRCLLALACLTLLLSAVIDGDDAKPTALAKTFVKIDRLIKQLDSDEFAEREAASKALEAIGEPALRKAASGSEDAEVRRRAEVVVKAVEKRLSGELRCFTGHIDRVLSVAFSPDGKRALSASADKTVRLWDVETGKELRSFNGHTGNVESVVFSADGKRTMSGGDDKTVRLWDVETDKELRCLTGHEYCVYSVAFSPDGKRALSGSRAGLPTFVHCRNGVSRSGMVVVAYEMSRNGWGRDEALAFVRSRRPLVRPNPAFMALLAEWDREVKGRGLDGKP